MKREAVAYLQAEHGLSERRACLVVGADRKMIRYQSQRPPDTELRGRLAPPMHPQTNGMVERFNGRIEDILQSHRFRSGEDLEQTILRYVRLYNSQLPQSVLKGRTPINALKDWQKQRPDLFRKRPYNHAGCDSYGNIISVHTGSDESATVLTAHGIEELRDMLLDARRSPECWSNFLEDFVEGPDIIARVKENGPR